MRRILIKYRRKEGGRQGTCELNERKDKYRRDVEILEQT
jgi:hypothetical protein